MKAFTIAAAFLVSDELISAKQIQITYRLFFKLADVALSLYARAKLSILPATYINHTPRRCFLLNVNGLIE